MRGISLGIDLVQHAGKRDSFADVLDAADPEARISQECRSEAVEAEARRGFSQARTTQAYPQRYVEEAEREKPRRARESAAAVGIHG